MHGIKAWQRRRKQGEDFPDDIDADQDGVVYYLLPADWDGNYDMEPVDGAKYRTWRESIFGGSVGNGRYLVLGFEGRKYCNLRCRKARLKQRIKIEK